MRDMRRCRRWWWPQAAAIWPAVPAASFSLSFFLCLLLILRLRRLPHLASILFSISKLILRKGNMLQRQRENWEQRTFLAATGFLCSDLRSWTAWTDSQMGLCLDNVALAFLYLWADEPDSLQQQRRQLRQVDAKVFFFFLPACQNVSIRYTLCAYVLRAYK